MIKHLVLFKRRADHSQADLDAMIAGFQRLPGVMPGLLNFSIGTDFSHRGSFDLALSCEFASEQDLQVYQNHPEHQRLIKEVIPRVCEDRREVVDYRF